LASIARDGHVLAFSPDIVSMVKFAQDEDRLRPDTEGLDPRYIEMLQAFGLEAAKGPKPVGLREASTFFGFCSLHDASTFEPIEVETPTFAAQQCFLIAYRAVSLEVIRKRASVRIKEWTYSHTPTLEMQVNLVATKLGLKEISDIKMKYDANLLAGDFSSLSFVLWELDANPMFATTGVIGPEVDFEENPLQDISDLNVPVQHLTFSVLPEQGRGYVLLAWLEDSLPCRAFADSLISLGEAEWTDAFLRIATESIENVYFGPDWYEGLPGAKRKWIAMRCGIGGLAFRAVSYAPDGIGFGHYRARLLVNHKATTTG
jgi:hypothetical protein